MMTVEIDEDQAKALVAAGFNLLLRSTPEELVTPWRATLWAGMKRLDPEAILIPLYERTLGPDRVDALEGRAPVEGDAPDTP